jgi:hypothetical protein
MRRIDLMCEKYPNNTVKDIKETRLSRCATIPIPCHLECEKCWTKKELTENEIKENL